VIKVLQALEATKSTYEKPLQKLVKEVALAKQEVPTLLAFLVQKPSTLNPKARQGSGSGQARGRHFSGFSGTKPHEY
jgi:hypothetical protein